MANHITRLVVLDSLPAAWLVSCRTCLSCSSFLPGLLLKVTS